VRKTEAERGKRRERKKRQREEKRLTLQWMAVRIREVSEKFQRSAVLSHCFEHNTIFNFRLL
jgi:hypothetical protein